MKPRQVPLQRKTALALGGPWGRTVPLPRTGPIAVGRPRAPRQRASVTVQRNGPARATLNLVDARDGDVCVICGLPGTDFDPLVPNHRLNRGMGGSSDPAINLPANIIKIHASENGRLEDAKGPDRERALRSGWKVKHGQSPADVPVLYPDGRRYLLDNEGGRRVA